ncbi:MAG: ethanolamine ammonia-lyase subunit EutC [Candidatus Obscuribacterales bacterium]|nr:ethanolamine ammonia-lyase subunit EutC [Candidatus Obscuribacterales bacterium]
MAAETNYTELTPARINVGRCGTRPLTSSWLKFRSDHARARDAVQSHLSREFIESMEQNHGCRQVQSICESRSEFVCVPPRGKICSRETLEKLTENCSRNIDVQIVISDGLSAKAVEKNLPDLLLILQDGLRLENYSYGTPVIVQYGRVAIADQIAEALNAKLVINLIGERPGLSTAESLSAYITFNPGKNTISSDRTVVSNIHKGGTPALEAGAYIVQLIKRIFKLKKSGVKLQQAEH